MLNKKIHLLILISVVICSSAYAAINHIALKSSDVYSDNNTYFLNAVFSFELTDEPLEALKHGIPLEIHTVFQLRMTRHWLWDLTINETKISHRLVHQPLTEDYLTINLQTGARNSFDNLDSALQNISSISELALFGKTIIKDNEHYLARIKTYLDLDSLPSPMRPQVYFSRDWDISSDWQEIEMDI